MPKHEIVKYTVEFDALEELSDNFVKRIIYEFFRSKAISVKRSGLTPDAADEGWCMCWKENNWAKNENVEELCVDCHRPRR